MDVSARTPHTMISMMSRPLDRRYPGAVTDLAANDITLRGFPRC
jgi:hypothetical protein